MVVVGGVSVSSEAWKQWVGWDGYSNSNMQKTRRKQKGQTDRIGERETGTWRWRRAIRGRVFQYYEV